MAHVDDTWLKKDKARTARYGVGKRWRAEWVEPGGGRKRKSFTTKDAAQAHLADVSVDVRQGVYVSADRSSVPVHLLIEQWYGEQSHWKETTRAAARSDLDHTILPRWGSVPVGAVTREDLQAWINGMDKAARTVDTIYGRFRAFLKWCVEDKRIATDPTRRVNLPRGHRRPHIYLTIKQVAALADAIVDPYKGLVWWLALTGMRIGEVAELRGRDIDLVRRRVRVERSVVYVSGRRVVDTPKSDRWRTVPMTLKCVGVVQALAPGLGDLVFTTERGAQIRANNFKRRAFNAAVKAANKVGAQIPVELTVKDLRHTAASLAVASGASVKTVQRMLGHASAALTLDVYAGLFDQDLTDVSERLDALVAQSLQPPHNPRS